MNNNILLLNEVFIPLAPGAGSNADRGGTGWSVKKTQGDYTLKTTDKAKKVCRNSYVINWGQRSRLWEIDK